MRSVHRVVFTFGMFVWTWLLLKPNPVPAVVAESLMGDVIFYIGKTIHLSMYAALMFYGTFCVSIHHWKWLAGGLVAHGILSELGQYFGDLWFQTHRTGKVADVLIDTGGVLVGWFLATRFQPITPSDSSPAPTAHLPLHFHLPPGTAQTGSPTGD
ncbi:hypothetical protein BH11PLA2_BH11PLA2_41110 [soil metagenome]